MAEVIRGLKEFGERLGERGVYWKWGKGPVLMEGQLQREAEQREKAKEYIPILEIGDRERLALEAIKAGDQYEAEILMLTMPLTSDWRPNIIDAYKIRFGGKFYRTYGVWESQGQNETSNDPWDIRVAAFLMNLGRVAVQEGQRPMEKYLQDTIDIDEKGNIVMRRMPLSECRERLVFQLTQMAGRDRTRIAQEFWEEMKLPGNYSKDFSQEDLNALNELYKKRCGQLGQVYTPLKLGDAKPFTLLPWEVPGNLRHYIATPEQAAIYALIDDEWARQLGIGEHVRRQDLGTALELDKRGEIPALVQLPFWKEVIDEAKKVGLNLDAAFNLDRAEEWQRRRRGEPGRITGRAY